MRQHRIPVDIAPPPEARCPLCEAPARHRGTQDHTLIYSCDDSNCTISLFGVIDPGRAIRPDATRRNENGRRGHHPTSGLDTAPFTGGKHHDSRQES